MSLLKEFKNFAMRGNVIDMAVGIIIGGAFGKIVASIVNDLLMPPIGLLVGGVDFKDLKLVLKEASTDASGQAINAVTLNYGNFIQTTVDFLIIAFSVFLLIKIINNFSKKKEEKPAEPPKPSKEVELLSEIRDLLKK